MASQNESKAIAPHEPASQASSRESQTAQDYIAGQLQLEADAREALPYQFDTCTRPFGALRQNLFSCLTCNPPPSDPSLPYTPAGVCYSCSISCHGEHELVELFHRRNFVCDCGTKRLPPSSPCALRTNPETGVKGGVHSEEPAAINKYNHNFRNRFCGCGELYDPAIEKGTMFQCLGLGSVEDGGCGEDWWHPECIMGLSRNWNPAVKGEAERETINGRIADDGQSKLDSHHTVANEGVHPPQPNGVHEEEDPPLPPGFPAEDTFDHLICYKCVNAFPWIRRYANLPEFMGSKRRDQLPAPNGNSEILPEADPEQSTNGGPRSEANEMTENASRKRKADATVEDDHTEPVPKKSKSEDDGKAAENVPQPSSYCNYRTIPPMEEQDISLFLPHDFRDHLCRCPDCFPNLVKHPQLLEEEDSYSPPVSEGSSAGADGDGSQSVGSRSLLDRGEAALSNMDRVRAIEGVMAYNHLRDKVKNFLKPFADSGQAVGAEDVKQYFEKLRGDEEAIRAAGGARQSVGDRGNGDDGDNRREQSGY